MDILKRIEDIRKTRGLSVYELAKRCGISKNTIYRWYTKNYTPTLDSLQEICEKGFNMSLVEFFAGDSNIIVVDDEIKQLIESWTMLSDIQKNAIIEIMKSYKK